MLGLPDKDYGEVVCAVIVPHEDAKKKAEQEAKPALTLEELSGWAKERLAPYKVLIYTNLIRFRVIAPDSPNLITIFFLSAKIGF